MAQLPRLSTLVVTCADPRVDPAHFLGLELGDAFVIRTIGGRVTTAVVQQIGILSGLARLTGESALDVAVIHHTDCATIRFADESFRQRLAQAAGTGEPVIEELATTGAEVSVAEDLEKLRGSGALPDDLVVAGYVYDVEDGRVREVSAPAPLRE